MKDRAKHGKEQEIAVPLKEAAPACAAFFRDALNLYCA